MSNTLRLFIASPLPPSTQQALMPIYEQRATYEAAIPCRVKWVPPEQWHVTWLFLGNVAAAALPETEIRFSEALKPFKGGEITRNDLRFWPSPHKPSLIVCRAELSPGLWGIPAALQAAFSLNPKSVKAFTPHITLARLKPVAATAEREAKRLNPATLPSFPALQAVTESLQTVGLYQSDLRPSGAVYTERYRYRFPQ